MNVTIIGELVFFGDFPLRTPLSVAERHLRMIFQSQDIRDCQLLAKELLFESIGYDQSRLTEEHEQARELANWIAVQDDVISLETYKQQVDHTHFLA